MQQDIANLKAGAARRPVSRRVHDSVAPGSCLAHRQRRTTRPTRSSLFACADAMREEYKAIIDAGFILQLDDPAIAENWDLINPAPTRRGVPAVHHAARRGAQPRAPRPAAGPHPLPPLLGQLARPAHHRHPAARHRRPHARGQRRAYSFEAANVRHEHEWHVWEDVKLPAGKVLIPGVVSHATNVVEHPELVADRIVPLRRASSGARTSIAGTDCGLGGRVHPQIAWAKLEALAGRGAGDQAPLELTGLRPRAAVPALARVGAEEAVAVGVVVDTADAGDAERFERWSAAHRRLFPASRDASALRGLVHRPAVLVPARRRLRRPVHRRRLHGPTHTPDHRQGRRGRLPPRPAPTGSLDRLTGRPVVRGQSRRPDQLQLLGALRVPGAHPVRHARRHAAPGAAAPARRTHPVAAPPPRSRLGTAPARCCARSSSN